MPLQKDQPCTCIFTSMCMAIISNICCN